jgi:predicted nuclease of predicted toxin-antitoxin system
VRFIVDAQLPPALARYLVELGHQAEHVLDLGLESSSDADIWDFAAENSAVIVTKDGDFKVMRAALGDGPSVVWIRIGNTTTPALFETLAPALDAIFAALEAGEAIIEIG